MDNAVATAPSAVTKTPLRPLTRRAGRSNQRRNALMRWLRKIHLYSGLALLPWVFIYGISGFLFNHGGSSADGRDLPIAAGHAASLALSSDELGARLLAATNKQAPEAEASISGSWTFDFRDPEAEQNFRLSVPTDGSDARLTKRSARASQSTAFASDTFAKERAAAKAAAAATLAGIGMPHEGLRAVGGPSLRVKSSDKRWFTTLTRDRVSESPISAFDLDLLMRRLHVTHGYNRAEWSRVIWAVFVDIMSFAMVMWAITGIAMWWQKKNLRFAGSIVVAVAFGGGVALILALQAVFNR